MFFEITAPVGALGLARDALPPGTGAEFERTAGLGAAQTTVILSGRDPAAAAAGFRAAPTVAGVDHLGDTDGASVYRLTWGETVPELVARARETDCTVLSGAATAETWTFELRFPDERAASRFYGAYDDPENPITLVSTGEFGVARQAGHDALTPKQESTLVRALETGYFDVPRRATLAALAAEFGVADTAVSQRLRRGVANVLRTSPHLSQKAGSEATADD